MTDATALNDLTKAQLVDYANRIKVPVKAQWAKGDIIDAIVEAEGGAEPVGDQDPDSLTTTDTPSDLPNLGHPHQPGAPAE